MGRRLRTNMNCLTAYANRRLGTHLCGSLVYSENASLHHTIDKYCSFILPLRNRLVPMLLAELLLLVQYVLLHIIPDRILEFCFTNIKLMLGSETCLNFFWEFSPATALRIYCLLHDFLIKPVLNLHEQRRHCNAISFIYGLA
jgi:hypothetical protein